ncbi:MAG: phosphotransferase [Bacteriovoracaceae bacterium]|nr:phosphotransferase [Bacteriovoracaceae bacterium]
MKLEQAESLLIQELVMQSLSKLKDFSGEIKEIVRLAGDASTRRYYRVLGSKYSFVVCLDTPLKDENEEYFFCTIQSFLKESGIRVPIIYDVDLKKGYLLEEDLSDETLLKRLASIDSLEQEFVLYKESVDILGNLHKLDVSSSHKKVNLTHKLFDQEKLMAEVDFTLDYFSEKFLKSKWSVEIKQQVRIGFVKIIEELVSYPMVFTHRDFHSRNIMMLKDEMVLIDFQDARLGIPQYDLVSLLEDCYYSIDATNKEKLISYYWNSYAKSFSGQGSYENFLRLYDLMSIQRVFKALGSFAYIFYHRKDERYLKYMGYGMEKIKHILSSYSEFNFLRKTLLKSFYEH